MLLCWSQLKVQSFLFNQWDTVTHTVKASVQCSTEPEGIGQTETKPFKDQFSEPVEKRDVPPQQHWEQRWYFQYRPGVLGTFGALVVMVTGKANQVGHWAKNSCVKPFQFSCLTKPLTEGSVHIKIPSTSSKREGTVQCEPGKELTHRKALHADLCFFYCLSQDWEPMLKKVIRIWPNLLLDAAIRLKNKLHELTLKCLTISVVVYPVHFTQIYNI